MNEQLKSLVHGTRSSLDQLIFFFQVKRLLPYEREALVQLEKSLKAINYHEQCTKEGDKTEIAFVVGKIKQIITCVPVSGKLVLPSMVVNFVLLVN